MLGVSLLGCVAALLVALLSGTVSDASVDPPPAATVPAVGPEIPALRTEDSRTYSRSDGARVTRVWAAPVNYRDAAGDWQPIDTTLKRDASGDLETTGSATDVTLPASADAAATVSTADGSVGFSLQGAADAGAVPSGSTASYDGVLSGVDASYEAVPAGVKETLTLADASAPDHYTFDLSTGGGLTAALRADGSVVLRDADGHNRFLLPTPTVQAADDPAPTAAHVAYTLSDDGRQLGVVIDHDWLASAHFPVKVDPSVFQFGTVGCTLSSATPSTAACGGSTLSVGHSSGGTQRAVLRFANLGAIDPTASIMFAQLFVPAVSQTGTGTPSVDVQGLAHTVASGATWNTYDGTNAWTTPGGDVGGPLFSSPISSWLIGGTITWDVSPLAQAWVRDGTTNQGVELRLHDETQTQTVTFGGLTGTDKPALEIDWMAHPGQERDGTYESIGVDDRTGASVNVASGNLALSSTDIHLPGVAGTDLSLTRTFNSTELTNTTSAGDSETRQYGAGWSWDLDGVGLYAYNSYPDRSQTIFGPGGAIYRFDRDAAKDIASDPATGHPDYGYDTPPGIDADLKVDQTTGVLTLTYRQSGTVVTFGAHDANNVSELTSIKDRHNNPISLAWRSDSQVNTITDTYGHVLTFHYSTGNQLQTITGPSSRTWTYNLTTSGTATVLGSYSDPDGHTTHYSYDTASATVPARLNKITDARGHDITLGYVTTGQNAGRVNQLTRPVDTTSGHDIVWQWDYAPAAGTGTSCPPSVTRPDGTVDNVFARTVETDPESHVTTYCYDVNGEVIVTFDGNGREVTSTYTAGATSSASRAWRARPIRR